MMFKYYTYKGLCLFNPEIINSNSLSNINKRKKKRKISFPFNIDFKLNYFKEKTHFFGSGIYVIEYDNKIIYIGKFRSFNKGNIRATRWKRHIETITNRGINVGGFKTGEKKDIFFNMDSHTQDDLVGRECSTGYDTSFSRLKFANKHWNKFKTNSIHKIKKEINKFSFHYFQFNNDIFFKKTESTRKEKLFGALASFLESYLLLLYDPECNDGNNGCNKMPSIKEIQKESEEFIKLFKKFV